MNWTNQIQTLQLVWWCFRNVETCKKKNQSRIMACAKDSKYEPLYTKFQNEKTTYMQNNPKIWLMLKYYFCQTTLWLQSMTVLGGACSVIGALNPHVSMVVVMNTCIFNVYHLSPWSSFLPQHNFPTWLFNVIRDEHPSFLRGKYETQASMPTCDKN